MTDPNHGNSIITRLRLIVERMHEFGGDEGVSAVATLDACRSDAENLLPLADVDDIEVIVLREAAAILNGRGVPDIANLVESAADEAAAELAAHYAARSSQFMEGSSTWKPGR